MGGWQADSVPRCDSGNHGVYLEWILKNFDYNQKAVSDSLFTRGILKRQRPTENNFHDILADLKFSSRKRDLQEGRRVHRNAVETGSDSSIFVAAALINMYAKCGSMPEALSVFDSMQEPDVVAWTALILGYADNGEGQAALEFFRRMKSACTPNSVTYIAAIKACTSLAAVKTRKEECLKRGKEIHLEIGHHMNHVVRNTLINMYAKLGSMADARRLFDCLQKPNVVSWTALILGYADNGEGRAALDIFSRMIAACECAPDSVTYFCVIKACTSLTVDEAGKRECLKRGREVHSQIGHYMSHAVRNALINMYAKCGSMVDARRVFDSIKEPDVVSWTGLILGYADNGEGQAALDFFYMMKDDYGYAPDSVIYLAAVKACTVLAENGNEAAKGELLKRGRQIHSEIGLNMEPFVQGTLINMYSKCGSMEDARRVFDSIKEPNVVSFTALIRGYADNGDGQAALDFYSQMKSACAYTTDSMVYIAAVKACTSLAADADETGKGECLKRGREIHSEIGSHMDHFLQSTLIRMYAEIGSMDDAQKVFDGIENPDVVSWTALILGYAENGKGQAALDSFSRMKSATGCPPDSMTYVAAVKACGSIGALAIGRKFHSEITDIDVHVVTCLVDFYAKCGSMAESRKVFEVHSRIRNTATWNALLAGYGRFGDSGSVFELFKAMQDEGFLPDAATFLCMLFCCSHAGLVEKAKEYLEAMPVQYGITPTVRHYNCMVDVLGRANELEKAVSLIQQMHFNPDAVTWTALLGACCKWKNSEIARFAFQSLLDLHGKSAVPYLAQIYKKCSFT